MNYSINQSLHLIVSSMKSIIVQKKKKYKHCKINSNTSTSSIILFCFNITSIFVLNVECKCTLANAVSIESRLRAVKAVNKLSQSPIF